MQKLCSSDVRSTVRLCGIGHVASRAGGTVRLMDPTAGEELRSGIGGGRSSGGAQEELGSGGARAQ